MKLDKKLFVLRVNNFRPDLCEFTIPTIKYWCKINGWKYIEITERRFHDMPITSEKLQIYDLGRLSLWNCICDADVMLRPDLIDPSIWSQPNIVRSSYSFKASGKFAPNKYFARDDRDIGISGGFVMSNSLCHDLWEPPKSWLHAFTQVKNKHLIDEYVLSNNIAKYGLHYDGVSENVDDFIVHFGSEIDHATSLEKASALYKTWLSRWPLIENQKPDQS